MRRLADRLLLQEFEVGGDSTSTPVPGASYAGKLSLLASSDNSPIRT
jgi:hypothetical protein